MDRERPRFAAVYVAAATTMVVGAPVAIVSVLEQFGLFSSFGVSALAGITVSILWATTLARLWMLLPWSRDVVFADLMVWGWLRRLSSQRRLDEAIAQLGAAPTSGSRSADLRPEERKELLIRLATLLEETDPYTHGHTRRVARHAYMIARTMGLPDAQVRLIHTAAAVHDVGKLHVPVEVLHKTERLDQGEFELIKLHSTWGAEMVAAIGNLELTAIVRHHHERIDGTGYPDRLPGAEIPLGARIIAVADTFDALTSTRSYRRACGHNKAIEILEEEAGRQLDRDAVKAFMDYYSGRASASWGAYLPTLLRRLVGVGLRSLQGAGVSTITNALAGAGVAGLAGVALLSQMPALIDASQLGPSPREVAGRGIEPLGNVLGPGQPVDAIGPERSRSILGGGGADGNGRRDPSDDASGDSTGDGTNDSGSIPGGGSGGGSPPSEGGGGTGGGGGDDGEGDDGSLLPDPDLPLPDPILPGAGDLLPGFGDLIPGGGELPGDGDLPGIGDIPRNRSTEIRPAASGLGWYRSSWEGRTGGNRGPFLFGPGFLSGDDQEAAAQIARAQPLQRHFVHARQEE